MLETQSLISTLILIASIQLLAVMSPGPDFALIVKTALADSRKAALITALGISLGVLVHMTYCILGLALIITRSSILFHLVKYLGAAYFIYIGIKCVLAKKHANQAVKTHHSSKHLPELTALRRGFLCNLLNPKAMLFFLGLFTLLLKPTTPLSTELIIGAEIFLLTFAWFALLSIMITHRYIKDKISGFQYYITKFMGFFFISFGIVILW